MVHVSTGIGDISAGFGDARAAGTISGGCNPEGVAVRQALEPGPVRGDRVELYDLSFNAPSPSLRGTEGEVSATPIERVANCGFLVELLRVVRVDAHAPFDKGRLCGPETRPWKRLRGFARWGSVPFDRDRGSVSSPSVGFPG
jgi:hypothetical protein